MKRGKSKIITIIFALILSLGALSFGVYAAVNASLTASGTVTFQAKGIDVDVEGTITGAIDGGSNNLSYIGTTNKTRQPSKNLITSTPWSFGDLFFDEESAMSIEDYVIEFQFKISNYSSFPIEASITFETIAGLTITGQNMLYSYTYDSTLGVDERLVILEIRPDSLETPVNAKDLRCTLNISKTLKKENAASDFEYSAPINNKVEIMSSSATLNIVDNNIIFPRMSGINKITSITNNAFLNLASLLKNVTIPNTMENIKDNAFNSSILQSVTIPASVLSIGTGSFSKLEKAKRIDVISSNANFSSKNGILYNKDQTKLLQVPAGKAGNFRVSSTVKSIATGSFVGCMFVSVTIPESVDVLETRIFYNNTLSNVYIEKKSPFTTLGEPIFTKLKSGSVLYFKSQTVMDQFIAGTHYVAETTTKQLY